MSAKQHLGEWIVEALQAYGGSGALVDVCKYVWEHHQADLIAAGPLFYTWHYDIRWAATQLRTSGTLRPAAKSPRGVWELK